MDISEAIKVLEDLADKDVKPSGLLLWLVPLLAQAGARLASEEEDYTLEEGEGAAIFAALEHLRYEADKRERDLVRHMKYTEGMTWQVIADTLDSQLGGRQAAQKRWARQVSPDRRTTTGDRRHGGRVVVTTTEPSDSLEV